MSKLQKQGISTYLMRNPHLLVMLIVIILAGGFSALNSLPRLEDPVITTRNGSIITLVPGASAERIEAQVSEKIENALQEIAEIKIIESTSQPSISSISIELDDFVTRENNMEIFSRVRDKLGDAAREFPPDAQEPVFDDLRGAQAFSMIVSLSWKDQSDASLSVLNRHAENLADRLRNIASTELVRLYGEPQEQILVTVDPSKMAELGITIGSVAQALRNADVKVPAGVLRGTSQDFLVEVSGEFDTVERIAEVPVLNDTSNLVRIGDLAEVRRALAEPAAEIARSSERRSILVGARVQADKRVDLWTDQAQAAVEKFRQDIDPTIEVTPIFIQDEYTSGRLAELAFNLLLGGLVILLVIFLFMGYRASLIVGSALPLSAGLTLFIVAMLGGKLHQMSIFGMIIALGLLIDNAIVVCEEVRKHQRQGLGRKEAVSRALNHLFMPLLASTMTTILAFAPILLLPGNAGDFIRTIGGSVIIALASSFFIAMTVIASLTGLFGRPGKFEQRLPNWLRFGIQFDRISTLFRALLTKAFSRPVVTMVLAALIPFAGFKAASTLGVQFFPRTDRNMFEVQMWLPSSTAIDRTVGVTAKMESDLLEQPGVIDVHWLHGESFPSVYYNLIMNKDGSSHYAQAIVEATDFQTVKELIPRIQEQLDENYPEAQVVVSQFAQGPPSEADVEFRIVGPGVRELQNIGEQIRVILAEHPSVLHTKVTMPRGEPTILFKADEEKSTLVGYQLTDLARQLQANLQGVPGGTVIEDVEELPVVVRFADEKRQDFDDLQTTRFPSRQQPQQWIPLGSLGELELKAASGAITRRNGERVNTIRGFTRNDALPIEVTQHVLRELERRDFAMPSGYRLQVGGDQENQEEAVGNLLLYLPVLSLLTVTILILTFRSVAIAALLGVVAFLSVGVGLLATWLAGLPLSFNAILGSLGLVGLAFNSSIVVLASIRSNEDAASGDPQALADRVIGSARHLISTTLTTIGSFLPLLILIGGDFWPPLAIVLAGGVGGSTLLAMFFTPSAFRLIHRLQGFFGGAALLAKEN